MRLTISAVMLITMAGFATSPGYAAVGQDVTENFSPAYQACITYGETHNTTAIPAAQCDARELRLQDAKLNTTYRAVLPRLSHARKADLRTDERNWIVARDATCGRRADPDLKTECRIDETIKRIAYLRRYR